jgi:tetratricopeptide (TPR) repeat protein
MTEQVEAGTRGRTDLAREIAAALDHYHAGRRDRAAAVARRMLRKAPDHAEALQLLGVIAHERGRHEHAVQLLSRAVASFPDLVSAQVNLGSALQALGRLDEAAAVLRQAIALKPDFAAAHCNRAIVLNGQGAHEAALESADTAIALMPDLVEAHLIRGRILGTLRRFAEAEAAYRSVLALRPDMADALSELGHILIELRRPDEAIGYHRQAAQLQPDSALIHLRLASAVAYSGLPEESEQIWRRSIALDPNVAMSWSGLGHNLRMLGRFDDARAAFERALELDPELPDAYAGLAIIGQKAEGEASLAQLRALLARRECPETTRVDANFALAMLLDNAGEYDQAFGFFAEANAISRRLLSADTRYDHDDMRLRVDTLIATCTPELYAAVEGQGNPSELPVFIVGMPRSGTSLVEQIAASHSCVFGAGELGLIANIGDALQAHGRDRATEELDPNLAGRLADEYVAHLRQLGGGAARVTDKMPDNILSLGLIGVLFPSARIIFCRRDLRDVCVSCFFQKFDQPIAYATDLVECALRGLEIERLADHWRRVLPQPMLTIDYERLVFDLEGESRRLIEFLGLEWEPACLEFHKTERPVRTASGWQVRQPLFTHSVGRWRNYRKHLGPLLEALASAGEAPRR